MELVRLGPHTEESRRQLEGGEADPWDSDRVAVKTWRTKDEHIGLRDDDGRLVAAAGLVTAAVEAGGQRLDVVGLGGVIVEPSHRGEGLTHRILPAALARAAELGPPFVVLFCHADRSGLYLKYDFVRITDAVTVAQPGGAMRMEMQMMWRALHVDAPEWPSGPVHVPGLPW